MKTVPWLPRVVAQPTMPSDLALHCMRMSPDFSSFRAHCRTSTISPSLSFRVMSFSLLVDSLAAVPSREKDSVRMVSLTTLKRFPPSSRKAVPWLPVNVIQPSMLSFFVWAWMRNTSTESSFTGPSMISTISPGSSLLSVLPSLMLTPLVITVSLETLMYVRIRLMNLSLVRQPSSSSSMVLNTLPRSSSAGIASSWPSFIAFPSLSFIGSFSQREKNAANSASYILSSLLVSNSANTSSFLSLRWRWWYLIMRMTLFSSATSSAASFTLASSLKRWARLTARESRGSNRAILPSSFFDSTVTQIFRSWSTPSGSSAASFLALAVSSLASLTASSTSLTCVSISAEAIVLAWLTRGFTNASTFSISSPMVATNLSISPDLS
mmetsp:Transcript_38216/g.86122  ORF Transcript_38216/g.86122 Transcript_38216/m.86122 type:complete len:381 (+) Transcript_38216:125-1267(+)